METIKNLTNKKGVTHCITTTPDGVEIKVDGKLYATDYEIDKDGDVVLDGASLPIPKHGGKTAEEKAIAYLKGLPDRTEQSKQTDIDALIPIARNMDNAINDVATAKAMGRSAVSVFKMETVATQKAMAFKNQVQAFKTKYGEYPPKV